MADVVFEFENDAQSVAYFSVIIVRAVVRAIALMPVPKPCRKLLAAAANPPPYLPCIMHSLTHVNSFLRDPNHDVLHI